MKPTLLYMVEVLFCSGLLLAFYRLLLHGRVSFALCRSYLLAAMVAALVIPALSIPLYPAPVIHLAAPHAGDWAGEVLPWPESANAVSPIQEPEPTPEVDWQSVGRTALLGIYIGIGLLSVALTLWRIGSIRRLRRRAHLTPCDEYTLAEHDDVRTPFSFLRTIFLRTDCAGEPRAQIICHEASHIRHGHSAERLSMEVLRCLMWFNPFVWIAGRWLTEAQEWQADRDVLDAGYDLTAYRTTIFHQLFGYNPDITCGLNHSLTKKRFVMMTHFKESKFALVRLGAVIPVAVGLMLFCSFTTQAPKVVRDGNGAAVMSGKFSGNGLMNVKADHVYSLDNGKVALAGNARFWLDSTVLVKCDSIVRYNEGTVEWFGNVLFEVYDVEGKNTLKIISEYGIARSGEFDWNIGPIRLIMIGVNPAGGYSMNGTVVSAVQIENTLAWYPEVVRPEMTVEIAADAKTPMSVLEGLKQMLRRHGYLRVRYVFPGEEQGEERMLPPSAVEGNTQVTVQTEVLPADGDSRMKERNVFFVGVNAAGNIVAGPVTKEQLVGLAELPAMVREFMLNPSKEQTLSDSRIETFPRSDGSVWNYPVSEGFVALQSHVDTPFGTYLAVQNAVSDVYDSIRDEAAKAAFGESYTALDGVQKNIVMQAVPMKIFEIAPNEAKREK